MPARPGVKRVAIWLAAAVLAVAFGLGAWSRLRPTGPTGVLVASGRIEGRETTVTAKSAARAVDLVHRLAGGEGLAVLVSTHYMDEAEHCDDLCLMQQGRVVATGSPSEIKAQAEARGGPLVVVQAGDFAAAFARLREAFPKAALYGRRIQWQSRDPGGDAERARTILAGAGLEAEVGRQPVSMEDAFASALERDAAADG